MGGCTQLPHCPSPTRLHLAQNQKESWHQVGVIYYYQRNQYSRRTVPSGDSIHDFSIMLIIMNTFFAICRFSMPTFGRLYLPVWEFYEKVKMADGKVKAKCNYC